MGQEMMNSQTTPELRTVPKIWICIDPDKKTITSTKDLKFDDTTHREYTDEDFAEQLTAAAIEERMK